MCIPAHITIIDIAVALSKMVNIHQTEYILLTILYSYCGNQSL